MRVAAKRGTFVSEWNVEELAERFEVMAELEAMCARLAARRISDGELRELEAAHKACRREAEAGDIDRYYSENSTFHACIYRATHNAFLAKETSRLHAILQPYRRMQLQVRNRMARSLAEHDAVDGSDQGRRRSGRVGGHAQPRPHPGGPVSRPARGLAARAARRITGWCGSRSKTRRFFRSRIKSGTAERGFPASLAWAVILA